MKPGDTVSPMTCPGHKVLKPSKAGLQAVRQLMQQRWFLELVEWVVTGCVRCRSKELQVEYQQRCDCFGLPAWKLIERRVPLSVRTTPGGLIGAG